MDSQVFINFFFNQDFLLKIFLLVLISLYGLFALILSIQIRNLNRIINQINFAPIFSLLATIHFAAAIALLLFTVVFL